MVMGFFAFGHPHVFFTSTEEFVFEDDKIAGCWVQWTFDSYFSADMDFYYDWDDNNFYDEAEIEELYNFAFINLENYHYFTFIRQGAERFSPVEVYNFHAWQEDGILSYRFYIDLSHMEGNDFHFAVYDYTFFCDIRYPDNSVTFSGADNLNVSYDIAQNKDYPVYYDPWGASNDTTIYTKWRPGLETYYPYEIHIQYEKK